MFLPDKLRKPDKWGFDKGLVDPKWDWLLSTPRLRNLMPFWHGAGARNLITGDTVTLNGSPVISAEGIATIGASDRIAIPQEGNWDDGGFVMLVIQKAGTPGAFSRIFDQTGGNAFILARSSSDTQLDWQVDFRTVINVVVPNLWDGPQHVVTMEWPDKDSSGPYRIWIDGVIVHTSSPGTQTSIDIGTTLYLGNRDDLARIGQLLFKTVYQYHGVVSEAQHRMLHADPFGPLRRQDRRFLMPGFFGFRQGIIDGLDSAQVEAGGWDAKVRDIALQESDVVRSNSTVVTITLPDTIDYFITADETITSTVSNTALAVATANVISSPTFDINVLHSTLTGTAITAGDPTEGEIVSGGKTIIITLKGDTWV